MNSLTKRIELCQNCPEADLSYNVKDIEKGTGKLIGYYRDTFKNKIMLVGQNPSYRRFPGLFQAFGGEIKHDGMGDKFIELLKDIGVLDKICLTNLVKCSSEDNILKKYMYDNCFSIFLEEVRLVDPPKIIALGRNVYDFLIDKLDRKHKDIVKYCHHPSYCLSYKKILILDYKKTLCNLILEKNLKS